MTKTLCFVAVFAALAVAGWIRMLYSRRSEVRRVVLFVRYFVRSDEGAFLLIFFAYLLCWCAYEYYSKQ